MIEIYLCEQLAAFAKYGTLSNAAEHLHLSQSGLSRSMKKLEDIFGVPLFNRMKNKISLNDTGKFAAEFAEKILQQNKHFLDAVREFDRKNRTISIGSCAPVPLNKIIFLLTNYFPDVTLSSEMHNDDYLLKGLQTDFFNIVIVHKKFDDDNFFTIKFGSEKLFLAVPLNHKFADRNGIYLEELNGEKILLYAKIGFWYDLCKEKAPNAKFLLQNERDIFNELVNSGAFLNFTTDFFLNQGHSKKNYIYKPILDIEADVIYYFVCKSNQKKRFQNFFSNLSAKNFEKSTIAYFL